MSHHLARWVAVAALLMGPAAALAQQDDPFFRKPETPAEYWTAVKFEMGVGKFDLAADFLKAFLASNPTDKDYLAIESRDGLAGFLELRNVPRWSENAKKDAEAKDAVEKVIAAASAALKKLLTDPQRIAKFAANLTKSPEERAFAIAELRRSGVAAVPTLLTLLREAREPGDRATILNVLPRLSVETVPPLVAALDIPDPTLKSQLLDVLQARRDVLTLPASPETDPLPALWYLSASPKEPAALRKQAAGMVALMVPRPKPDSPLPPAKVALVASADRFYRHQARFLDPTTVTVWRWTGKDVSPTTMTISQAEEYYGLRSGRRALELDPVFPPAQLAVLSLATEKAAERAGAGVPLSKAAPSAYDLLATAPTGLLVATLERAMAEQRSLVALNVVRALGDRAEPSLGVSVKDRPALLVRALRYPDRRVQLAAAAALVRIPGPPRHEASAAIVEVLRRALAVEPPAGARTAKATVLIGDSDRDRAEAIARLARDSGYAVVLAPTGRDVMRRLRESADIDVVFIDARLPYPGLPQLLADLRSDVHVGLLPVRVIATPDEPAPPPDPNLRVRAGVLPSRYRATPPGRPVDQALRLQWLTRSYRNVGIIGEPLSLVGIQLDLADATAAPETKPLAPEEKKQSAVVAVELLRQMAVGERPGYDVRPAGEALRQALRVDELAPAAVPAVGRLATKEAQAELAKVVLMAERPLPIRLEAARVLVRHIQQFGPMLSPLEVTGLQDLAGAEKSADLRARAADLVGVLASDPRQTGMRLENYTPPGPAAGEGPKKPPAEGME